MENKPADPDLPGHLQLGRRGEDVAAGALSSAGYAILERNWRHCHLEIDLICEYRGQIVFVEVKTRKNRVFGGGAAAVSPKKQRLITLAAQHWLLQNNLWEKPCRFDVVCVYPSCGNYRMEHYPNAFCQTLDSRHADWQYR